MSSITFQLGIAAAALNIHDCESDKEVLTKLREGVKALTNSNSMFLNNEGLFATMVTDTMVSMGVDTVSAIVAFAKANKEDIFEALRVNNITARETDDGVDYAFPVVIDGEYSVIHTDQ